MKKILILILGILIFVVVSASEVEGIVCCEKIRGSAEYCVDVQSESSCDTEFNSYQGRNCDRVASCQLGCCVTENTGSCVSDQDRVSCERTGGFWMNGNCNDVDACQKGCCFLSTNTYFGSEGECRALAREKGLEFDFRRGFSDNTECQEELDRILGLEEKGCCVSASGDCSYGIRGTCSEGQFRSGYCMEFRDVCDCEVSYDCVNNKKDVYRISTCGDEEVVERCDEINTYCGFVRSNEDRSSITYSRSGSYYWEIGFGGEHIPGSSGDIRGVGCVPFGCREGESFVFDYNKDKLFSGERVPKQIITINSEMLGGAGSRRHGESWCMSPSEPNEPGSRYYVYRCDKGKIIAEGCHPARWGSEDRDADGGICKETTDGEFTEARCVDSDWTRQEARDHPNRIEHPPAVQFYQGGNLRGVSVGDSCGYCNRKDKWYEPWNMCDGEKCSALGDCSFDHASFGFMGCAKGAVIAEVLWLSAGQIAVAGENTAGIAQGTAFENTGWTGFWDSGLLGDFGNNMAENNLVRALSKNPDAIDTVEKAEIMLRNKPSASIPGLSNGQKGVYISDAQGVVEFTTDLEKAEALGINLDNPPGRVYTYGKKVVEGAAVQQGVSKVSDYLTDGGSQPASAPQAEGASTTGSTGSYDVEDRYTPSVMDLAETYSGEGTESLAAGQTLSSVVKVGEVIGDGRLSAAGWTVPYTEDNVNYDVWMKENRYIIRSKDNGEILSIRGGDTAGGLMEGSLD